MSKFRKKPVVIEAIQFTEAMMHAHILDAGPMPAGVTMAYADYRTSRRMVYRSKFVIKTLEGNMEVSAGDWVITGVKGEVYPCKPDIFAALYDAVDESPANGTASTAPDLAGGNSNTSEVQR